jgi:hypothetical protein
LSQEVSQQNGATGAKGRYTQNAPERKINDRRFGDRRDGAHRCSIGSASAAPDTSRGSRPVWSLHAHALAAPTAKLLLRASRLALLPVDNPHVAEDLAKIKKGKQLSPIPLVRGELANDVALQMPTATTGCALAITPTKTPTSRSRSSRPGTNGLWF